MDEIISDQDFDRLWQEAAAEVAVKCIKHRSLSSKHHHHPVDPKECRRSSLPLPKRNSQSQRSVGKHENNVASSSKKSSRRSSTSALELKRRQESNRNPQKPPLSPVVTEEESNGTNTSISAVNSISGSERGGGGGGGSRRRSSISKVPSLPSFPDMSKLTIHGREDLSVSDLSALDLVPSNKTSKTNLMDGSVSSLTSAFSGFDSVHTAKESQGKHIILNGNSSKSINSSSTPEADTNKKNNKAAQAEAAKYVLQMDKKAESSHQHQLVFEIPTTFEVKGHKDHHKQSTGLVLSFGKNYEKDAVMVKEISPISLFVGTSLKSGQEVLMINSLRVKCPKQAAKIMKSLSGDLAIYVSEGTRAPGMKYIRVRVGHEKKKGSNVRLKPDEDMERLLQATKDITLETQSNGLVRVARVDPSGMFRKDLRAGDIVLTVNGTLIKDDEGWKKLILETATHGVICMLIYSMADLVKGLVNQLLPSWESAWKSDMEVSISRARKQEGEAMNDAVSFSLLWSADWVCECNQQSDEEAVYKTEILPSLEKMNWATSLVIKSFVEVSGVQHKQSTFIDVSNATDRTAEATDDESSYSDQKAGESQQLTDPVIEAVIDDDSDELGQRCAPRRGTFKKTSAKLGKSFMHEIHADDDSSFEEC